MMENMVTTKVTKSTDQHLRLTNILHLVCLNYFLQNCKFFFVNQEYYWDL